MSALGQKQSLACVRFAPQANMGGSRAELEVIAASASFCRAFDIDPATVPARPLSEIGQGEWAMPKLASLLKATASGSARIGADEIDLVRPNQKNRQLIVNAHTLDDGDAEHVRLLLAVTDVTEARAEARLKDDLVRDKAILLQEVQHRVANTTFKLSPASSCRALAKYRVMSIAALQRQPSTSSGARC